MMNEMTSFTLQTNPIYPVVVDDPDLHNQQSLSLYWLPTMYFLVEYSRQIGLYQIIHYPVMIWWIETMIKCWE